jgi:hypothetical protein
MIITNSYDCLLELSDPNLIVKEKKSEMAYHDSMLVRFGSNIQRMRFEELFEREMSFQIYPETRTMTAFGVTESVKFMINQLGWDNLDLTSLPTYRNLTLEFLSSFKYDPDYGYSIHKGLARFRLFGIPYRFSIKV